MNLKTVQKYFCYLCPEKNQDTNFMAKTKGDHPKSFSRFSLADALKLGIELERDVLFQNIPVLKPTQGLLDNVAINPDIASDSEAAKSMFMISPVVREIVQRNPGKMTVFPGYTFEVDASRGLTGACDFIFSKVPKASIIKAPTFFVVEAKNESLQAGAGQLLAELYAARIFNEKAEIKGKTLYGVVTFGREWQFYQLKNNLATQDIKVYTLEDLPKILGIMQHIIDIL